MTNLHHLWVVLFLALAMPLCSQNIKKIEARALFSIEKSTDDYLIKTSITDKPLADWRIRNKIFYAYYYNNRILENQGGYYGQLLNGQYHKFNKQKLMIESGKYKKGVRHGLWKYWDNSGNLIRQIKWRKGVEHKVLGLGNENEPNFFQKIKEKMKSRSESKAKEKSTKPEKIAKDKKVKKNKPPKAKQKKSD